MSTRAINADAVEYQAQHTAHDFRDGAGRVPAHRHINYYQIGEPYNPCGSLGGWVADTATVHEKAYVDIVGKVYGHAEVGEGVQVYGCVCGNAKITGIGTVVPEGVTVAGKEENK